MTSPSGIRLDIATLLSTSIECILYGISLVLFGGTVWALTHGRPQDERFNWSMALVSLTLMILSTIHVAVDIQRLVLGFITKANFPGGPIGFFADVTQRTFIIKNAVYVLQTLLGDGVVIYRCYVIWQRFRVVILPALLWCATFATSAGSLYHRSHATYPENLFSSDIGQWVILFYVLTIITNILGSGLLAYRIWMTNRDRQGVIRILPRSWVDAMLVFRVLIDAAVLYTLTLFVLLVCYAFQNTGRFIVLDMLTPIISIAFYTILVRISIARHDSTRIPSSVLSPLRFAVRAVVPSPSEARHFGARRSSI